MFRLGRSDISLYREALSMQAFNKESNNLFGFVIKAVLSAKDEAGAKEPWRVIEGMLTEQEYREALKKACNMWKHVIYIQEISS